MPSPEFPELPGSGPVDEDHSLADAVETGAVPAALELREFPAGPWALLRKRPGAPPHPLVYRRMVKDYSRGLRSGDEVEVLLSDRSPGGRGLWSERSQIALRILTQNPEERIDADFFHQRIADAVRLRREVLALERVTDAFRVVHAEGDGLSGLIVDRFGDAIVIEYFSLAMQMRHTLIAGALLEQFPDARISWRVDSGIAEREGIVPPPPSDAPETQIHENKMRFWVAPGGGHKTGFFLDQRENRERFASLVRGRKVLDGCCYSGGFSIACRTLGKARKVVGVDLDEKALLMARRNAALNHAEIEWVHSDIFPFLRAQRNAAEPFDAVVLDPSKWAQDRDRLPEAHRRYRDLNLAGIRLLRKGGILLTCSCSGLVSLEEFLFIIRAAATEAGREVQILQIAGAAADHPVAIQCPEGSYLKAVFARVR